MVVVLPLPLTPMTSSTNGFADAEVERAARASESISALRWRRKAQTRVGISSSRRESELRISSSSFWLVRTPMSAVSSTFSISSTTDGSSSLRAREDLAEPRDEARRARARQAGRQRARPPSRLGAAPGGAGRG